MSTDRPLRIPPLAPEEWSDANRRELAALRSPADGAGPSGPRPVHLPSVIARHPSFLGPYLTWARAVALEGVLPRRDNALLALRTALRCQSGFEWGVHADTARRLGVLDAGEIERIASGPADAGWEPREAALLRAVDDLCDRHAISDATWSALSKDYDTAALLEITFVVGHYTMLSMVANSAGVAGEAHWAPLGASPR